MALSCCLEPYHLGRAFNNCAPKARPRAAVHLPLERLEIWQLQRTWPVLNMWGTKVPAQQHWASGLLARRTCRANDIYLGERPS